MHASVMNEDEAEAVAEWRRPSRAGGMGKPSSSSSSSLLSSLELSGTHVYEPYIRALLGTASHFCELVVLKLGTCAGGMGETAEAGRSFRSTREDGPPPRPTEALAEGTVMMS